MGSTRWSDEEYASRALYRASTGKKTFHYDDDIRTGRTATKVHDALNPFGVKVRESRDSDVHPESLAVAVLFDVTGSMNTIPQVLQKKLCGLMNLLITKGYAAHPQILFGANGDATCDAVPLQIGQFESGLEMEDDLGKIFLEGGGGGQHFETYELGLYFMARHTAIDCWEKRGRKGYIFTIGDESFYPKVVKEHVKKLIGDDLPDDISTEDIVRELEERYNVFHIFATKGSYAPGHPYHAEIIGNWKALLGERVLMLDDTDHVAELIATTIGLIEGTTDMLKAKEDLSSVGMDAAGVRSVSTALAHVAHTAVTRTGEGAGLGSGDPNISRL